MNMRLSNSLNKMTAGRASDLKMRSHWLIVLMKYILNALVNIPVESKIGHSPH